MKVKGYEMISEKTALKLNDKIRDYIARGWHLYGYPLLAAAGGGGYSTDQYLAQAMVIYEDKV